MLLEASGLSVCPSCLCFISFICMGRFLFALQRLVSLTFPLWKLSCILFFSSPKPEQGYLFSSLYEVCFQYFWDLQTLLYVVPPWPSLLAPLPWNVKVFVTQLCPTLCDPMDCSLPGSSVHGIFQARILEWAPIPFSRESFPTHGWNPGLLECPRILYSLSHQGSPSGLVHLRSPPYTFSSIGTTSTIII